MNRCIPYVRKKEGKSRKEAAGKCSGMYDSWKKENNMEKTERVLLHLCAGLNPFYKLDEKNEAGVTGLDRSTILVGDGVYNGIYFPKSVLEKCYKSFDKQPININHSDKVEDIVGHIAEPRFDSNKITVRPVLHENTVKYNVAQGFINSRIRANAVPEVSVGIWVDKTFIDEEERENYPNNAIFVASNGEGDHLSLVTRGACSPEDGCGIGLKKAIEKGYLKPLPEGEKIIPLTSADNNSVTIPFEINEDEEIEKLKLRIKIEKEKQNRR
jgi:hypothetical protein